jgi:hypothetical protein
MIELNNRKKRARVLVDHGPRKISFASATRLSRKLGTRGFPSHDYSWFGFIGNIGLVFFCHLFSINFNAKTRKICKPFDFKGLFKELEFQGGTRM